MKGYTINEQTARLAHEMMSFRDYREGERTAEYQGLCAAAADMAEREKKRKPEYADAIDAILDRYAQKLAAWMNRESQIGTMCPSILVAGGDGFSAKRKQKQIERMEAHMQARADIDKLLDKIRTIGTGGIKSEDALALVKLESKITDLTEKQETMKAVNAYYRKHKTLDGCDLLTPEQLEKLKFAMSSTWHLSDTPYAAFTLQNNSAEIRRIKKRMAEISAVKEAGSKETEVDCAGLRLVENAETMRIQLFFADKPTQDVRSVLKAEGFRWAPSAGAWQRQLTTNGKKAALRAFEQIKALIVEGGEPL